MTHTVALLALVLLAGCGSVGTVVGRTPPPEAEIVQIKLAYSNVFLIKSAKPVLIDAGSPGDEDALRAALEANGVRQEELALVVLTHGHGDHAGLAAWLQRAGAKVVLGRGDRHMARAGRNDPLKATSFFAAVLRTFVDFSYPPFAADIELEGELDLAPWGIAGKAIAMHGHTPGAVVVTTGSAAFVGDMILGGWFGGTLRTHHPIEHLYQDDLAQNHRNRATLVERGVETFFLGHGGPVAREDVIDSFDLDEPK